MEKRSVSPLWERASARDNSPGATPPGRNVVPSPASPARGIEPYLAGTAPRELHRAAQVFHHRAARHQRADAATEPGAAAHPKAEEAQP